MALGRGLFNKPCFALCGWHRHPATVL